MATNAIGGDSAHLPVKPRSTTRVEAGGSNRINDPSTTIIVDWNAGDHRVKSFGPRIAHSVSRIAITARYPKTAAVTVIIAWIAISQNTVPTDICRRLNDSIHGKTHDGKTLTAIATAAPSIATAVSFAHRTIDGGTGSGSRIAAS